MLVNIIIATLAISLLSLVGISIFFKKTFNHKIMESSIALAAAVLLGNVFFHLLPEMVEGSNGNIKTLSMWMLGAIVFLFFTEKYLHWHHGHHHHDGHQGQIHPMGYNVILGDSLHNLIDGIAIASSFMISTQVGIVTTIAIALHEIPQEISDFGLLLKAGFTKARALAWNFASAILALIGGVAAFFFAQSSDYELILVALAAGSFLYIALSDVVPHLHGEKSKYYGLQTFWFIAGLAIMYILELV